MAIQYHLNALSTLFWNSGFYFEVYILPYENDVIVCAAAAGVQVAVCGSFLNNGTLAVEFLLLSIMSFVVKFSCAVVTRLLFILISLIGVWRVTLVKDDNIYWFLTFLFLPRSRNDPNFENKNGKGL